MLNVYYKNKKMYNIKSKRSFELINVVIMSLYIKCQSEYLNRLVH